MFFFSCFLRLGGVGLDCKDVNVTDRGLKGVCDCMNQKIQQQ